MSRIESFGIIPFAKGENGQWQVLLILHRKGRHWGFPKGKSNPGETPWQAAVRELKEETGLDVAVRLQESPIQEEYHFNTRNAKVHKKVCYFSAVVTGELQIQLEEIRSARWYDLEEASAQLTFAEAKQILKTSQTLLNQVS